MEGKFISKEGYAFLFAEALSRFLKHGEGICLKVQGPLKDCGEFDDYEYIVVYRHNSSLRFGSTSCKDDGRVIKVIQVDDDSKTLLN